MRKKLSSTEVLETIKFLHKSDRILLRSSSEIHSLQLHHTVYRGDLSLKDIVIHQEIKQVGTTLKIYLWILGKSFNSIGILVKDRVIFYLKPKI